MSQSICVGCLGSGPLFENKSVDELEQEDNQDYWKTINTLKRLW